MDKSKYYGAVNKSLIGNVQICGDTEITLLRALILLLVCHITDW